jgi:pyrroloquinoline quinone biosynthesis protein B|tara:strand:+ start:292 stop:1191 length:900 start_codon:yes stop_codon:yes gene_type:complete
MNWVFTFFVLLFSSISFGQTSRIIILGTAQDAGYPQAGCNKKCCHNNPKPEPATCFALVQDSNYVLFEATPDFKIQLKKLNETIGNKNQKLPEAIFLTHAHIGHYTGLVHLGREAMGANKQKVYVMPRMQSFLQENGPWSQLVKLENIVLKPLINLKSIEIMAGIKVTPIQVPHRDEFSETAAYLINSGNKKALFIPDIDKWEKWDMNIDSLISTVDYAFLDGTFFSNGELPGRDMSEIPHPFIKESMQRFSQLEPDEKAKIYFIHFNHTNPAVWDGEIQHEILSAGFNLASNGLVLDL